MEPKTLIFNDPQITNPFGIIEALRPAIEAHYHQLSLSVVAHHYAALIDAPERTTPTGNATLLDIAARANNMGEYQYQYLGCVLEVNQANTGHIIVRSTEPPQGRGITFNDNENLSYQDVLIDADLCFADTGLVYDDMTLAPGDGPTLRWVCPFDAQELYPRLRDKDAETFDVDLNEYYTPRERLADRLLNIIYSRMENLVEIWVPVYEEALALTTEVFARIDEDYLDNHLPEPLPELYDHYNDLPEPADVPTWLIPGKEEILYWLDGKELRDR